MDLKRVFYTLCFLSLLSQAWSRPFLFVKDTTLEIRLSQVSSHFFEIQQNKDLYLDFSASGWTFLNKVGEPKIPIVCKIIETDLEVELSVQVEYDNLQETLLPHPIYPTQFPIAKTPSKQSAWKKSISAYSQTNYLIKKEYDLIFLGQAKDKKYYKLLMYPMDYIPSKQTLSLKEGFRVHISSLVSFALKSSSSVYIQATS